MRTTEPQLELEIRTGESVWQRIGHALQRSAGMQFYDRHLLWASLILMALGLVMVASASLPTAERLTGNPFYFVTRHSFYMVLGTLGALLVLMIPVARWQTVSGWLCLLAIGMLAVVLVVGHTVNGATRWLKLGPFTLQVAEFAKLFFVIYMASYLDRRYDEVRKNWKGFMKALLVLGVLTVLLLAQPDLGTVVVLATTAMTMLWLAGARAVQFFGLVMTVLIAFVLLIAAEPYRMARVTSFMNPWDDPFNTGYQLTQSLMAFGRGDWLGQGLGNSVQKLQYLPEAHTDFILSVIGEELGFVGVLVTILLVGFIVFKAMWLGQKALRQKRPFSGYLAQGIGIWFSLQAAVNMGAASGLIPTKGLTLPFVSYGGSSLLVMCAAMAILLRIDYEVRTGYRLQRSAGEAAQHKGKPRTARGGSR
ncbi:cell division protein FtsW [Aliidiomarina halalkaliphila]|uniref:Probable peptidoglycan glycosyltransferase FtsW n=1 Tax=Aliidiomarina halalkaliphila TaxID=2593535 RepID=A0A552X627_9GAMM|nr:cell division protein FtsW [Aliidiomarina halalkaliphila]TRW50409.1 cell division protein FtsW [Aliidiomarina halalkaliphila]